MLYAENTVLSGYGTSMGAYCVFRLSVIARPSPCFKRQNKAVDFTLSCKLCEQCKLTCILPCHDMSGCLLFLFDPCN
jgi:hypothetical protein